MKAKFSSEIPSMCHIPEGRIVIINEVIKP